MSKPKTLFIIRHGQTDYNKLNIIQGSGIDSDLNIIGKLQAQRFYDYYKNENFDFGYVSMLKRTFQSIAPFVNQGLAVSKEVGLNEINWGILEGAKSTSQHKLLFEKTLTEWQMGNLSFNVAGGETPIQMFERQQEFLQKLLLNPNQKILIASHGRALRGFICLLKGEPLTNMHLYPHTNLGLYVLEQTDEKTFDIKIKNSTEHLEEALLTQHI
jgi:probable phosphoglycerate mutase